MSVVAILQVVAGASVPVREVQDVARVIAMLLSEEGSWINAQTIEVSGGYFI